MGWKIESQTFTAAAASLPRQHFPLISALCTLKNYNSLICSVLRKKSKNVRIVYPKQCKKGTENNK